MVDIQKHFEKMAHEYDQIIDKVVPYYADMLDSVILGLPFQEGGQLKIVDLGCGTGNLTKKITDKYAQAEILSIDLAKDMIELAQNRFIDNSNIQCKQADMCQYSFDDNIDAVVSSLVLHHIREDQIKIDLYKTVYEALNKQGVFVIGDIILGESDHIEEINTQKWIEYMTRSVSMDEIENKWVPRHYETDRPCTLSDEISWLKSAGFSQTFVIWKYFNLAVYGGIKE